jgi:hydroxyacyl-ACP dehydratase HTD2-like protein with hotdog domain
VAIDRSAIGTRSGAKTFLVERGAISTFAAAIGDDHPAYRSGEVAPPTFPTTFRLDHPAMAAIDPARHLHANEEYVYTRPLRAGDLVTCQQELVDLFERSGRLGRMTFAILETVGQDANGTHLFTGRSTIIIREVQPPSAI